MTSSIKQAIKNRIDRFIRNSFLDDILLDRIHTEQKKYVRVRLSLKNTASPYRKEGCESNDDENFFDRPDQQKLVFISSRFRTGSTMLWNIFRNIDNCRAYYEPFNERQWFNRENRGERVDNTHLGVSDYWAEYDGLEELEAYYSEDWIRHELYMDRTHWNPSMKAYIETLANTGKGHSVLQFNRVDFRLPWLKFNFPQAKILHLYRNPRDQWCSFLVDASLQNKERVTHDFQDHFYLHMWAEDLSLVFPVLKNWQNMHPYKLFYYLWKLSFLFGKKYSDYSISFESIVNEPEKVLKELLQASEIPIDDCGSLASLVGKPTLNKWARYADESWFSEIEHQVEMELNQFFAVNEELKV